MLSEIWEKSLIFPHVQNIYIFITKLYIWKKRKTKNPFIVENFFVSWLTDTQKTRIKKSRTTFYPCLEYFLNTLFKKNFNFSCTFSKTEFVPFHPLMQRFRLHRRKKPAKASIKKFIFAVPAIRDPSPFCVRLNLPITHTNTVVFWVIAENAGLTPSFALKLVYTLKFETPIKNLFVLLTFYYYKNTKGKNYEIR